MTEDFIKLNQTTNDPSSMWGAVTIADQTKLPGQLDGDMVIKIDTSTGKHFVQEFEIYNLVPENSPILKTPTKPYDLEAYKKGGYKYSDPENPVYLVNSLFQTMFKYDGLGLAAPQCGIPYSVFVMGTQDMKQVMFNPVIVQESLDRETDIEGCLSYKNLLVKVPRSKAIRVQWQQIDGTEKVQDFVGLTARIIQHEVGHLRGEIFFKNAGKVSLEMAKKKRAKLMKALERNVKH